MVSIAKKLLTLLLVTWFGQSVTMAAKLPPERAIAVLSSSLKCLNNGESNTTCKLTTDTEKFEIKCSNSDEKIQTLAITQKYRDNVGQS